MLYSRPHRAWLILSTVLLLLLGAAVYLVQDRWQKELAAAHGAAERELGLLASLVKNGLLQGNYQQTSVTLVEWGETNADIVSLRLQADNGFLISSYQRAKPSQDKLSLTTDIQYSYAGRARLAFVKDLAPLKQHRERLILQLATAYLVLAGLLTALTRSLLLSRKKSIALQARTQELDQSNADLRQAMAQQQQAEDERDRLVSMMEATPDMVSMADTEGHITYFNRAGRVMTGIGNRALSSLKIPDVHPQWAGDLILHQGIPAAIRDGHWSGETALLGPDGEEIPVSQVILSHRDAQGRLQYLSTIIRDVSAQKRVEATLRESEARLSEAQHLARLGSWELDLVNDRLTWSDEIFRIFEIDPARFGASYEAFINAVHPDDRDFVNQAYSDSVRTRIPYDITHRLLMPDGRVKHVREVCRTSYNAQGEAVRSLGTVQDITELKQTEAALHDTLMLQHAILDHAGFAIISTTPEGLITSFNPAAQRMLGYAADEVVGKLSTAAMHLPAELAQRAAEVSAELGRRIEPGFEVIVAKSRLGLANENEWTYMRKDGSCFPVWLSVTALHNGAGEISGFLGMAVDITARKRADIEMKRYRERLEQMVEARTTELKAANQELESFAYSVSHDLRGPLRAIDGFAQALLEDYGDRLDTTGRGYLDRVRSGTQRMSQLIDDLLKLSRLSRATLQPETVDLSALARDILAHLHELDPERPLQTEVMPDLAATGDPGLLRAALENLLGNAWKYSSKQPRPRIEFGATRQDGETVYFVRDNGVGFDMAHAGKLFGAFQRLHHRDEFEGTGIGLATVQRIVHRHGGRIWAEAAPGQGATFYFTLGRADTDTTPAKTASPAG
ncbi:MAG: PAS domain S-box protein [Hydrogenophilaceae bacterium]|nr:PAS domain S-box protein [Hydrogenophilaceae bacterium]